MFCIVFILSVALYVQADAVTTPSDKPCCDQPQSASFLNRMRPVREGQLLLLHDQMQQGDTLLKERLHSRYQHVRDEMKEGDKQLKEQLREGDARLKEQLKEGDARLKEEISQDEQWVKDRLTRGEDRLKEELAETREELQEQKDNFKKLQQFVEEWTKRNDALVAQQVKDLSDAKTKLQLAESKLVQTQAELETTKEAIRTLEVETEACRMTREQLVEAKDNIKTLENAVNSLQEFQLGNRLEHMSSMGNHSSLNRSIGSTFVRWGRTDCPDNSSLVYSRVAGGSDFEHTGGASNPLCLVMDPQLDMDLDLPKHYTLISGGEYQQIRGHHDQDVPCSVCLVPQSPTIMVPATLTCPPGWTPQYTGYLMAGDFFHKGGTEYVCVDQDMQDVPGGHESRNGHLFSHVFTQCGSLPCPPFVQDKAVTCVVCSL